MGRGQRRARPAAQPALDGAVPADMPAFIKPQLATEVSTLPEGEWMLQGKLDGYRLMVRIDGADVRLLTRNGHDWSAKMPVLARELAALDMDNAWLDGEVVALVAQMSVSGLEWDGGRIVHSCPDAFPG